MSFTRLSLRMEPFAMKTIWCLLLLAVSVDAATYSVKAGGGGNYTTIQACASAISSGDTCVVYAGTYNEHVTLTAGGVGAYKTLQANGNDLVYVYDFTINSHNKISGFQIQNPVSPHSHDCVSVASNSTDIYVTNNVITECGGNDMYREQNNSDTSHVYIQGNTFSYGCETPSALNVCAAIVVNGDYHLIENNDLSHVYYGVILLGTHNVIRNNSYHDLSTVECGSNSSNCHFDFILSDPTLAGGANQAAQYNLVENNKTTNNLGQNSKGYLAQANACQSGGMSACYNLIIRYNIDAHEGSGAITDDNSADSTDPGYSYVKAYNNTWVDYNNYPGNQLSKSTATFANNSTHGAMINNLFYYPQSLSDFNPYSVDASSATGWSAKNNLAFCTGTPCNLHGSTYGSGNFIDDAGNIKADPLFVSYASNDFRLAVGSPAIGAGTYLTTVAAGDSGSGTSLVVNDASFFQDGSGITGVNADCVSVTTVTNHICITAVNYATNTLTLASGITRSAGDPVWLYSDSTGRQVLFGSAPNIGATFDPPSSLAPPTSLTAVAH